MIGLENVVKEYGGPLARLRGERVRALDGVSLRIAPGEAWGVVGPNGAGKSTLLRLLLGYAHPTRGAVHVAGLAPRAYAERHGVAYVPERVTVPPAWTVRGALEAFAALAEVDDPRERIGRVVEALELEPVAGRRVGALSKGSLQRLALAQAFLAERRLMVLDEAADGLDPGWTERLRGMLEAWRAADPERVLVFASHDLEEVERVAERVVILAEGRVRETVDLRPAAEPAAYLLELPAAEAPRAAAAFPGAALVPRRVSLRERYAAAAVVPSRPEGGG
jgi:ABC-2 type transport system ATP-binding protein